MLLESRAHPNSADRDGRTSLDWATRIFQVHALNTGNPQLRPPIVAIVIVIEHVCEQRKF